MYGFPPHRLGGRGAGGADRGCQRPDDASGEPEYETDRRGRSPVAYHNIGKMQERRIHAGIGRRCRRPGEYPAQRGHRGDHSAVPQVVADERAAARAQREQRADDRSFGVDEAGDQHVFRDRCGGQEQCGESDRHAGQSVQTFSQRGIGWLITAVLDVHGAVRA